MNKIQLHNALKQDFSRKINSSAQYQQQSWFANSV